MAPMAIASADLVIVIVGVVSQLGKFVWKVLRSIIWRIYNRTPRLILHGKGLSGTRFSVAKVDSRRSYVRRKRVALSSELRVGAFGHCRV